MTDLNKERELQEFEDFLKKDFPDLFEKYANGNYFANVLRNSMLAAWVKAKAQAVPEGYVLMPKVPTEKMFQAYERSSVAPMSTLSKTGYKAMVEAAGDQNENS